MLCCLYAFTSAVLGLEARDSISVYILMNFKPQALFLLGMCSVNWATSPPKDRFYVRYQAFPTNVPWCLCLVGLQVCDSVLASPPNMAHETQGVFGELGNPNGRTESLALQTVPLTLSQVDPWVLRVLLLTPRREAWPKWEVAVLRRNLKTGDNTTQISFQDVATILLPACSKRPMEGIFCSGINSTLCSFVLQKMVWLSSSWDHRLGSEAFQCPSGFQWLCVGAQIKCRPE